jgi:penicillin-binding protein 1A
MISNPVENDPILHPKKAKEERKLALDRMVANGVITRAQATEFDALPLPVGRCTGVVVGFRPADCGTITQPPEESYFVEEVKQQLLADPRLGATYEERYAQVFGGGLQIYTTLDPIAQNAAQDAHDNTFPSYVRSEANAKGITTAMVSVESATGAVRALVGGPGFADYKYDIATHEPGRQTGSTFKTFVILTALEQGVQPDDTVGGGGSWPSKGTTPDPYVISGGGGTLTGVTQASSNGAFVRLGQTVGLENVVYTAQRLGVSSQFDPRAKSMPLGVFDVTPLEMASAYSAIPNGGVRQPSYFIDRVESHPCSELAERMLGHANSRRQCFSRNGYECAIARSICGGQNRHDGKQHQYLVCGIHSATDNRCLDGHSRGGHQVNGQSRRSRAVWRFVAGHDLAQLQSGLCR